MLVQGPMTNTLENFDRAADSVVCGAEPATSQSQTQQVRLWAMLILALSLFEDTVSTVTVSNNLTLQMKPSIDFCALYLLLQLVP